ncbi:FecCD family ABC transporter permease [Methanospirillum stamsii]|uniref:Cobalamin import system permease protein BtuC n=1 Tax=Methanospirillum stamsii TaxID=1277351 RepID=A0A2V2MNK9_9EURY|nr:iron ABC transporter permease [Methanospirillum stamsii]PWR69692.1 iron ABC transporter permease [Methanospirillum stamsii]
MNSSYEPVSEAAKNHRQKRSEKLIKVQKEYRRLLGRKIAFLTGIVLLITFAVAYIITLGPLGMTIPQVYETLLARYLPGIFNMDEVFEQVVWNIRFPRIIGGIFAGFGFGICGCVMQAVLKNPLASPFTLGISSGAHFGVAIAAVFGVAIIGGEYLLIANAFLFAMLCSLFIVSLAALKGATSETLILAGIAVNYLFSSLSQLMAYFANDEQLRLMSLWGMGDLSAFSWSKFGLFVAIFVICTPILLSKARDLNLMTIGDDSALSLGVNANRVRMVTMMVSSVLVATIVCFTGTIGFIGLVAPHMARMLIGTDHRILIPASGILGACLLICADAVAMNIIGPTIIPTGIMTALLGVPFFLYLVLKGKRKEFWQ